MGILLVEKIVQSYLVEKFKILHRQAAVMIPQMFPVEIYGPDFVTQAAGYFSNKEVHVKPQYPKEGIVCPAVYVASSDNSLTEDTIGYAERFMEDVDTCATTEVKIYRKSARIIAASEISDISLLLAGITQYLLHQEEEVFNHYNMFDMKCEYREIDLISRLFPPDLFYRNFLVTFAVGDTIIVSEDDLIKNIYVDPTLL